MVAFACFCYVFFHCHVKLPASIAAICPLGGAVTWASNGETCCTTTLSAGVPDWFGKQFLDVFGLLSFHSFPRFPKVSQGFPRFPKSQNSVLSQNHLFKYYQDDRSHCDRRNLVGELQELTRQASEQNFQARPQLQTTEELSARVIHNTSVEAWLFAVPGSPNNKTLISPDHRGTGSTDQTLTSPASQAISTGKVFAGSSKKLACGLHSQDSKQWLECH